MDSLGDVARLWQAHLDANYTRIHDTDIADGRDDFYVKGEFLLAMLSASCWWNQDTGFGAGGGVNYYMQDGVRIWYSFKYNSYISLPLYKRSINDKGYSFEWGCMASML